MRAFWKLGSKPTSPCGGCSGLNILCSCTPISGCKPCKVGHKGIAALNKDFDLGKLTIEDYYGQGQNNHILYKRILIEGKHIHLPEVAHRYGIEKSLLVLWRDAIAHEHKVCKNAQAKKEEINAAVTEYERLVQLPKGNKELLNSVEDKLRELGVL